MEQLQNRLQNWYSIIWNDIINNKDIWLDTKWLYCYLISRPPDWNFNFWWIQAQLWVWKKKISRMVKELETIWVLLRYCINIKWDFKRIWILHPNTEDLKKENIKDKVNKEEIIIKKKEDNNTNKEDKIEVEKFIEYWNKIFNTNNKVTTILLKQYSKIKKEYWKEGILSWFNNYIKSKKERDWENWQKKYLLTPLKFLKQQNGLISYI